MYALGTRKIISSYDVVSDDIFLVHWHIHHKHIYKGLLCIQLCHTHLMIHLQEKITGNIITFTQFEEGKVLSETCDNTESGNKSDDD